MTINVFYPEKQELNPPVLVAPESFDMTVEMVM
jgi:hypothetical protein